MEPRTLSLLLPLLLVMVWPLAVQPAPPTCYSRMLTLSREIMADFQSLHVSEPENYCVLAKLLDFVASPQCWKMAEVDTLKDKVRKLYTIMNSFCRRDLVFLSDDCNALEYPIPESTAPPGWQS
ncbi:Cytokine-like protein 1 [Microtus ochrogaster]|uniref:Cytokine-like protein 1 n=1 Tax=Microtus ochrogaster TaxID=79684 RepID=A0A8J6L683_MICOH|nr:Cytokine-like protein 1 [Microtus ochrogaster]